MTRILLSLLLVLGLAVGSVGVGADARAGRPRLAQAAPPAPPRVGRLAEMQHHFAQVSLIHEALIRGDLPAVREPALQLETIAVPDGIPVAAAPYVANIRLAGRRAALATTLASVASATVQMLTQCGECHRAYGIAVMRATPPRPDVGGLVGHMLEHQRAADDMLFGLFVPSASQWRQGALRLRIAPLRSADLPPDPKLPRDLKKAEADVHAIAKQAETAADAAARASSYTQLLTACAACHSAHSRVWGPGRGSGPTASPQR